MILVFLLQLLGLALIGAAMHAAPLVVKLRVAARRRRCTTSGWIVLAASMPLALGRGSVGVQVLNWFGLLSLSAAVVLLSFTKLIPRRVSPALRR